MSQRLVRHRFIFAILVFAALLRFWALDRADVITDEALYAFRSVGYLDFLFSPDQPTPIELLNARPESAGLGSSRPAWTYLSFHDAPPLTFILQGAALHVLGENLWGVRVVFALAGVMSVFLVYLIARRLAGGRAGHIGAAVMAVFTSAVWVSRVGLLESLALAFSLLAVWCFVRAFEPDGGDSIRRWARWAAVGATMGLAFLTKYTTFMLIPLFVVWLLWERRLRDLKYLGAALAIAVLVFSPVIIYNLKLFEVTGHFDLQFSYLLGQHPVEWQRLPGKEEVGTFGHRIWTFIPNLSGVTSPLGLAAFAVTAVASAAVAFRRPRETSTADRFFLAGLATAAAVLLVIGPSFRFLPMLSPWLALLAGLWLARWLPERFSWWHGLFGVLLLAELAYSVNTSIIMPPIGSRYFSFSRLAYDRYAWGYNDLEQFLAERLDRARPGVTLETKYAFVNDLQRQALASARQAGKPAKSLLVVYDASLSDKAVLWSLHRRLVYRGWPVVSAGAFRRAGGESFFRQQGVREFLFIKAEDGILRSAESPAPAAALAVELSQRGVLPRPIATSAGSARITAWEF